MQMMQLMPAAAESLRGLKTLTICIYGYEVRTTSIHNKLGLPTAETKGPWIQPHVSKHTYLI